VIVTRAGFLTSVQDLGRTGFRQFGVSLSGALDSFALRVANLLVDNNEGAAGLEITFGGLQLHFQDKRIVAWCSDGVAGWSRLSRLCWRSTEIRSTKTWKPMLACNFRRNRSCACARQPFYGFARQFWRVRGSRFA